MALPGITVKEWLSTINSCSTEWSENGKQEVMRCLVAIVRIVANQLLTVPKLFNNTLLEYDITRRDPLSVVMVCWFTHSQFHLRWYSLRITLKYTTLHAQWFRVNLHPWQWTGSDEQPPIAYSQQPLKTSPRPTHKLSPKTGQPIIDKEKLTNLVSKRFLIQQRKPPAVQIAGYQYTCCNCVFFFFLKLKVKAKL